MRLAKIFALGIVMTQAAELTACVWINGTKSNGEQIRVSGLHAARRLQHFMKIQLPEKGQELESRLRGATNFNDRTDYAVALIYLGRPAEAVQLLQKLEAEKPGAYTVAANLGTALELAGDDPGARRWIEEGIKRNPESHRGTEWVHLRILDAKLAAKANPHYFATNTILNLKEGHRGPVVSGQQTFTAMVAADAIQYQLQERLQFVKPTDPVVAALLVDYAWLEAENATLESALGLLKLAQDYGYPKPALAGPMKRFEETIARGQWRATILTVLLVCAAGAVVVWVLAYCYRRGIFVLSSRDLRNEQ